MDEYCISDQSILLDVIKKFESNKERATLVLSNDRKIVGVVSQGDIIRAIDDGTDLHARVDKVMNTAFLYLNTYNIDAAFKIFKKKNITLLPVVDGDFKLLRVITMKDIYEYIQEVNKKNE